MSVTHTWKLHSQSDRWHAALQREILPPTGSTGNGSRFTGKRKLFPLQCSADKVAGFEEGTSTLLFIIIMIVTCTDLRFTVKTLQSKKVKPVHQWTEINVKIWFQFCKSLYCWSQKPIFTDMSYSHCFYSRWVLIERTADFAVVTWRLSLSLHCPIRRQLPRNWPTATPTEVWHADRQTESSLM